jgi:hypothetical protein
MSTGRLSRTPTALNCAGGFNRFEDDHLCKCFVYCPCQSCRPPEFDFENCQLKDWTGIWENHTIAYKSGAAVTEKKKEMRAAIKGFSEEVEQGTFLVVGLSAKEAADDDYVKKNFHAAFQRRPSRRRSVLHRGSGSQPTSRASFRRATGFARSSG